MAKIPVDIEGLNDVLKKLDSLGAEGRAMKKEVLDDAVNFVQEKIKEKATTLDDGKWTTEDKKYKRLYENIKIEWDESTGTYYVTSGDAYWAVMLEHGSVNTKPQPFMANTFRQQKKKMIKMVAEEVKKRLGL